MFLCDLLLNINLVQGRLANPQPAGPLTQSGISEMHLDGSREFSLAMESSSHTGQGTSSTIYPDWPGKPTHRQSWLLPLGSQMLVDQLNTVYRRCSFLRVHPNCGFLSMPSNWVEIKLTLRPFKMRSMPSIYKSNTQRLSSSLLLVQWHHLSKLVCAIV